jgi:hypothetical protein
MRADDSLTEGVLRLFCLGLHGDAWIEASSNIDSLSRKDFGHFSNERIK